MAQTGKEDEAVVLGGQDRDDIGQGPSHLHRIKHDIATITVPPSYLTYKTGRRTSGGLDHGRERERRIRRRFICQDVPAERTVADVVRSTGLSPDHLQKWSDPVEEGSSTCGLLLLPPTNCVLVPNQMFMIKG